MSAGYPKDQAVALLLPTGASGFVQEAATAIEAGYAAARMRDTKARISDDTLDTNGEGAAAMAFKQAAEADPRPLIIGPLLKGNVNAVAGLRSATGPAMLALNQAEAAHKGLYQFSLAPEAEAKTVAALVRELAQTRKSLKTAVVYPANDPWGESMRSAFVSGLAPSKPVAEISYGGGRLGSVNDELGAVGADLVFMLARPEDAVRVYSALRSGDSGLAVIATSHAADKADARADLKDLFYVDIPWIVDRDKAAEFQQRGVNKPDAKYTKGQLGRLYAMGIDAYYLGAKVANAATAAPPALTLDSGMTGALSFAPQGRMIKRRLALGRVGTAGALAGATLDELAASTQKSTASKPKDDSAPEEADDQA